MENRIPMRDNEAREEPVTPQLKPASGTAGSVAQKPPSAMRVTLRATLWGLFLGLLLGGLTLFSASTLREWAFALLPEAKFVSDLRTAKVNDLQQQLRKADRNLAVLNARLERLIPRDPYLIVNSTDNQILVMKGKTLLHKGTCSTGSNVMLKSWDDRQWFFATPRGMFRVHGKIKNPTWRMPDWAFIEEGLPVPEANSPERIQFGVLGDYALSFGNGYFVHGTLYKRTLGMPVTHGCIRLDDDDLRMVYQNLGVGAKIFVY